MEATIKPNVINITREQINPHLGNINMIFIDLPEGWDTLKPLTNKVLEYKGKNYVFMAWNSDRNEAWFRECPDVAIVKRK